MDANECRRKLTRAASCSWIVTVLACGQIDSGAPSDSAGASADNLVGSWDARFTLDHEFLATTTHGAAIFGTLLLTRLKSGPRNFQDIPSPSYYGLYDLDFSPYGFDSRRDGAVPTVVAARLPAQGHPGDSVLIVLDPERRGVTLLIRGDLHDDRVTGKWVTETASRSGIAVSGEVLMTRRR